VTTWKDKAYNHILTERQNGIDLGLQGDALKEFVNNTYPFGLRMYAPYRAWLSQMKLFFNDRNHSTGKLEIRSANK
jgi:hypothetical protein